MITTKIKNLFQFIEYLHSNIDNFNLNNDLIKELELLNLEEQKVKLKKTFKDKLKYDELQSEKAKKFKILQDNTVNLIKAKAKELNVCNFGDESNYSFYDIETDIRQLKENFGIDDLPEIFKHKQKYIEYRTKTHKTFFSFVFFYTELDEITKSLFDYFKETEQNEFEQFETKTIQVNNLSETLDLFSIGKNKVSLPIDLKQPQNNLQYTTHEKLFEAVIFSVNESENKPIEGAFELLKEVWFFLNSDTATFNGKDVEKYKRPLLVNPIIVGKPEFEGFFEAEITYCLTQNKIGLKEQDFIKDISDWIEKKRNEERLSIPQKRKFKEFLEYLKTKALPHQTIVKQKPELKIDQIALKYVYEGLQITRENGNDIAKEYGHNSGEKLFQRFTYFSSSANRKGKPNLCTPKKLDNKIKLIESIIELLHTDKQERAKDEVSILKKIYEAEYQ